MNSPSMIVVPVDVSPPSRAAVLGATGLAQAFDAPIHLVQGLESPTWTHSELRLPPLLARRAEGEGA